MSFYIKYVSLLIRFDWVLEVKLFELNCWIESKAIKKKKKEKKRKEEKNEMIEKKRGKCAKKGRTKKADFLNTII